MQLNEGNSDLRSGVCPGDFHFSQAACCAGLDVRRHVSSAHYVRLLRLHQTARRSLLLMALMGRILWTATSLHSSFNSLPDIFGFSRNTSHHLCTPRAKLRSSGISHWYTGSVSSRTYAKICPLTGFRRDQSYS